jgi:hypothetical protein
MDALPPRASSGDVLFGLYDVLTGQALQGACVRSSTGPVDPLARCAPEDPRVAPDGRVTLAVPEAGPFHVRLFGLAGSGALDTYPDTLYFGLRTSALTVLPVPPLAVRNEAALVSGTLPAPGTAMITGRFVDCGGRSVHGALARLVREDGTPVDTRIVYGDGFERARAAQPWTHIDGLFGAPEVEVREPGETVYLEIYGRTSRSEPVSLVACEAVQIVPDVVSIYAPVGPLHGDGPSCPGAR